MRLLLWSTAALAVSCSAPGGGGKLPPPSSTCEAQCMADAAQAAAKYCGTDGYTYGGCEHRPVETRGLRRLHEKRRPVLFLQPNPRQCALQGIMFGPALMSATEKSNATDHDARSCGIFRFVQLQPGP